MPKITEISAKKMKLKMRLVAGNGIRPDKIRPEGPLIPQQSSCKILWSHLKNSWKKTKKTYPQTPLLRGADLKWTNLDNIDVACSWFLHFSFLYLYLSLSLLSFAKPSGYDFKTKGGGIFSRSKKLVFTVKLKL